MKTRTPLVFFRESFPLLRRAGVFALAGLYLFISTASNIPSLHHHPLELAVPHSAASFPGDESARHSDDCLLCHWQAMGQDVPQVAAPSLPVDFTYWTQFFVSDPVAFESSAPPRKHFRKRPSLLLFRVTAFSSLQRLLIRFGGGILIAILGWQPRFARDRDFERV